jgi:hypothetical protein
MGVGRAPAPYSSQPGVQLSDLHLPTRLLIRRFRVRVPGPTEVSGPALPESSSLTRPSSPTRFPPSGAFVGVEMAASRHLVRQHGCRGGGGRIATAGRMRKTPWSLAIAEAGARALRPRADGSAGEPNPGTSCEARSETTESKRDRGSRHRDPNPLKGGRGREGGPAADGRPIRDPAERWPKQTARREQRR